MVLCSCEVGFKSQHPRNKPGIPHTPAAPALSRVETGGHWDLIVSSLPEKMRCPGFQRDFAPKDWVDSDRGCVILAFTCGLRCLCMLVHTSTHIHICVNEDKKISLAGRARKKAH